MFPKLRSLLRTLRQRARFEHDMDEELRFHLDARADALVKTGLTRRDAVRRARLEFGNPEALQDRCRESRGLQLIDDLVIDIRFALRTMRRDATLSAAVIVTLALGIGATSAIFSVVNGVVLRPLPYPNPDRLMVVGGLDERRRPARVFGPDFLEWRAECRACEQMAADSGTWLSNVTGGVEPDRVRVGHVSDGFFATMGVQPTLGRAFRPDDTGRPLFGAGPQASPATAVILSHSFWQRRFGGDPSAVGQTVNVEGDPCTIVGVMPAGFGFPDNAEAWVPVTINTKRDNAYLRVITRLRAGVTEAEARAELQLIAERRNIQSRDPRRQTVADLVPLQERIVGDVRPSLLVFFGAVGLVLLIACANVANLLLAQAATRPKELAVRTALGASRRRITRQLLTESLVLALVGGGLGFLLAGWLLQAFVALAPAEIPRLGEVAVDRWMLGFTWLLSTVTGLLFGLAPVVRTSGLDLTASLQEGGARASGSVEHNRTRRILVVAEVALALILLIGAGLLLKSFVQLRETPLGFDPSTTLTASVTLPDSSYPTGAAVREYYRDALARVVGLPDVQTAGIITALPLGRYGARISGDFLVDGESKERPGSWARKLAVGGDYFRAARIPLIKGRLFDERDTADARGVLIIGESLAQRLWPNEDPIGRRMNIGFGGETWRQVVGVVGDVKQDDLGEPRISALYQPYAQVMDARRWLIGEMTFVIRTTGQPERVAQSLRSTLAQLDPNLPLYDVTPMTDVINRSVTDPRFYTILLASFSLVALVLAAAGIYSLIARAVTQRTHEIGIRMALGAQAGAVVRMIIGEGLALVVAGLALGLLGALALTRLLTRFLYHVTATDGATFALIPVMLGAVALIACYLPARRASRVDPIVALRHE